jgi:hypothetical protein
LPHLAAPEVFLPLREAKLEVVEHLVPERAVDPEHGHAKLGPRARRPKRGKRSAQDRCITESNGRTAHVEPAEFAFTLVFVCIRDLIGEPDRYIKDVHRVLNRLPARRRKATDRLRSRFRLDQPQRTAAPGPTVSSRVREPPQERLPHADDEEDADRGNPAAGEERAKAKCREPGEPRTVAPPGDGMSVFEWFQAS